MSENAIEVEGLGKRYRIGAQQERYKTLRDHLVRGARSASRRVRALFHGGGQGEDERHVWALKDASFTVKSGEVVGVIGRNGAGKTTLLKILSRITEPTAGEVRIRGRVGSLLEVGTGFHPELTGRENVFLNGAILGMKRQGIERSFDEIVAFAEVERFIDTQVKHYSSGMYLRLAFAVAAHLNPDILLVDEVLAVGDLAFQRKCLGKMGEVAAVGRTVLLVSHNMEAVQRLCGRSIWLDEGRVVADGSTSDVLAAYLRRWQGTLVHRYVAEPRDEKADAGAVLLGAEILSAVGEGTYQLRFREPFAVRMRWQHRTNAQGVYYFLRLYDFQERLLFAVNSRTAAYAIRQGDVEELTCEFPSNELVPGEYWFTVGCNLGPRHEVRKDKCVGMVVVNMPFSGDPFMAGGKPFFAPPAVWKSSGPGPRAALEERPATLVT